MKKISISILILFVTLSASAQYGRYNNSSAGEFRLGLTAGVNFSNLKNEDYDFSVKAGLKIGAIAEYAFNDYFALSPELVFTQRGCKKEEVNSFAGMQSISEIKWNINYIQLPINAIVRYSINDNLKIMGFAGPYFAYALSGKKTEKGNAQGNGISTSIDSEEEIKFGSGEKEWNPLDIGLTIGAGVEFFSFFFRFQYELGLNNLADKYTTVKNTNFGLSIGYLFRLN